MAGHFVLAAPLPGLRGSLEEGYASQCIAFTEIDFETLNDAAVRRLFLVQRERQ